MKSERAEGVDYALFGCTPDIWGLILKSLRVLNTRKEYSFKINVISGSGSSSNNSNNDDSKHSYTALCTSHYSRHFMYIDSFNPHNTQACYEIGTLLLPFYRRGKHKLSNMLKFICNKSKNSFPANSSDVLTFH